MINYISGPIILPIMKAIGPTTSEELHSQKYRGTDKRTNKHERTDRQTEKLYASTLSYAGHKNYNLSWS